MARRIGRLGRYAAALAMIAMAGTWVAGEALTSGCTLLVNASSTQCNTDADCAQFTGTYCGPQQVCIGKAGFCATNQDCLTRFGDSHHFCKKDPVNPGNNQCVDLFSPQCSTNWWTSEEIADDNTIFIGALSFTAVDPVFGTADQSINLARNDFNSIQGIPFPSGTHGADGGSKARRLAVISCNPQNPVPTNDDAVAATNHLINDVGVPAIIGPVIAAQQAAILNITIGAQVPLLTAGQGSITLTNYPGRQGYYYRLATLDDNDMKTRSYLATNYAEAHLKQLGLMAATDKLRVALLKENSDYGNSGSTLAASLLNFNGETTAQNFSEGNYTEITYGDPTSNTFSQDVTAAVGQVLAFKPHVIIMWGALQMFDVDQPVETAWTSATAPYRPYYILGAPFVAPAFEQYITGNSDLRERFIGDNFTPPATQGYVPSYSIAVETQPNVDPTTVHIDSVGEGDYDSVYLVAYAIAALGTQPVTGANLSAALKKVTDPNGQQVQPGPGNIGSALTTLLAGGTIKYNGVIGPLNFNQLGDVDGYTAAICVSQSQATRFTGFYAQAGVFYDPTKKAFTGTFFCPPEENGDAGAGDN